LAFNTVQTQLRIMEDKGLVAHRAGGRTFVYRPKYTREKLSKQFLQKCSGRWTSGAGDARRQPCRRRLEELIAEHRRQKQATKQDQAPNSTRRWWLVYSAAAAALGPGGLAGGCCIRQPVRRLRCS
jgi:hypothetical protein